MLQLSYEIQPDEHGVYDGKELARELIMDAYRLLAPYVNACPDCADNLFSVIANEAIEEIHRQKNNGKVPGIVMALPSAGDEAKRAHYLAEEASTIALLEKAKNYHSHEH